MMRQEEVIEVPTLMRWGHIELRVITQMEI